MRPTVLTVDDDEQMLFLITRILSMSNVKILQANGGKQGLDILERTTPDVLLLDLLMPHITGFDILDYVNRTPRLNLMRVVLVTVQSDARILKRCGRANAHVLKPFVFRDLQQVALKGLMH